MLRMRSDSTWPRASFMAHRHTNFAYTLGAILRYALTIRRWDGEKVANMHTLPYPHSLYVLMHGVHRLYSCMDVHRIHEWLGFWAGFDTLRRHVHSLPSPTVHLCVPWTCSQHVACAGRNGHAYHLTGPARSQSRAKRRACPGHVLRVHARQALPYTDSVNTVSH